MWDYLCDSLCPRDIHMTIENTIMPTNRTLLPWTSQTLDIEEETILAYTGCMHAFMDVSHSNCCG